MRYRIRKLKADEYPWHERRWQMEREVDDAWVGWEEVGTFFSQPECIAYIDHPGPWILVQS